MDASHITIVATSLGIARDMAKALMGVRDFNLVAEKVSGLNEQLLKAQDALLAHSAAMFQLQQENFEAREQLRKLKETGAERSRYSLFEVARGKFAYRMNVSPEASGAEDPGSAEPLHYLCQSCYDGGVKSVLFGQANGAGPIHTYACTVCKTSWRTS